MMAAFLSLNEEVKNGNFEAYYSYLDHDSQQLVSEFSDPNNMTGELVKNLGVKYKIPFWAAEYYRSFSKTILGTPKKESFFIYLAESKTPLFDYYEDYYLVEDKSRIRKGRNYIVAGRDFGKLRYVEFLEYHLEEDGYKLDLVNLLQLQNTLMARAIHETWKDDENPIPNDWQEQSINEVYNSILRDPKPIKSSYSKIERKG